MKITLIIISIIGGLVILSGIGVALNLITIPWLKFTSQVQMNRDIVEKTYTAENAIYNYHWFQERSGSIKALSTTIDQSVVALSSFETLAGERKNWTFEDKTEDARLRVMLQGQKAQYNSLVEEYNARAKEVDRNIFQDLPLFFNLQPY